MKQPEDMVVFAEKSTNLNHMKKLQYDKLWMENITKFYKKTAKQKLISIRKATKSAPQ